MNSRVSLPPVSQTSSPVMPSAQRVRASLLTFLLLFTFTAPLAAATAAFVPPMPRDLNQTDFYLLTVGLGAAAEARFGHTMVRVADRERGADYLFNWGIFDFDEPGFLLKFFRGILVYRLGLMPFHRTIAMYKEVEKRTIWQELINLTRLQKETLMKRMIWNAQPENVHYSYQYFFDNCSTRPRDYFDEALGGKFKEKYGEAFVPLHHRDYVRKNLSLNPLIGFGVDIMMNGDIDRPMRKWEEMFLPIKLREYMLEMPAIDDAGREIPGKRLLSDTQVLIEFPETEGDNVYGYLGAVLLVGLPLAFGLFRQSRNPKSLRWLGGALTLWGLIAGFFGSVHVFGWLFSAHTDLYHNANLWLFWPTDHLFTALGLGLLTQAKIPRWAERRAGFLRLYGLAHLLAAVCMAVGYAAGLIHQEIGRVLMFMAPLGLVVVLTAARVSGRRAV